MAVSVQSPGWNTAEVAISGKTARIRVNNGIPVVGNFSALSTVNVDWDLKMYIGGTLPNLYPFKEKQYLGFVGRIGALRINYQEYSVKQQEEWRGAGLPLVSVNVGEQPGDIDAQLPDFSGGEYAIFPCNIANDSTSMDVSVLFKAEIPDGVLIYIPGAIPGSFVAVSLSKNRLTLTLNMGSGTVDVKSEPIALYEWVLVNVVTRNFAGDLRINLGPAIQLEASGQQDSINYNNMTYFHPLGILFAGGVNLPYEAILKLSIGYSQGLVGKIHIITVGRDEYSLRDATLTTNDKYVDSASASLAAKYHEVHAKVKGNAWLRCNYSMMTSNDNDKVVIKWLKWDRLLDVSDEIERVDNDPRYPMVSSLQLKKMNIHTFGMYACQIRFGGIAMITNAFGISIYKPPFPMLDNDQVVMLLVLMSVAMLCGFIMAIIVLSFCKPLRRRYYIFDRVYESVIYCLGCDKCATVKTGFFATFDELRAVDATYEGFSAREEKAKLDAKRAERKKDMKAKITRGKEKTKHAVTKMERVKKQPRKVVAKIKKKAQRRTTSKSEISQRKSEQLGKSTPKSDVKMSSSKSEESGKQKSPTKKKDESSRTSLRSSSPPHLETASKGSDIPSATGASADPKLPEQSECSITGVSSFDEGVPLKEPPQEHQEIDNVNKDEPIYANIESLNKGTVGEEDSQMAESQESTDHHGDKITTDSVDDFSKDDDEPIYMNIESINKGKMNRRESINEGVKDMGGHMFNVAAGGAAAALSAAIADLEGSSGNSATASVESLAYDLSDIAEGLEEESTPLTNVPAVSHHSIAASQQSVAPSHHSVAMSHHSIAGSHQSVASSRHSAAMSHHSVAMSRHSVASSHQSITNTPADGQEDITIDTEPNFKGDLIDLQTDTEHVDENQDGNDMI